MRVMRSNAPDTTDSSASGGRMSMPSYRLSSPPPLVWTAPTGGAGAWLAPRVYRPAWSGDPSTRRRHPGTWRGLARCPGRLGPLQAVHSDEGGASDDGDDPRPAEVEGRGHALRDAHGLRLPHREALRRGGDPRA